MKRTLFCIAAALVVAWGAHVSWARVLRGENDFLQLYCGAILSSSPDLHSPEANYGLHRQLIGTSMPAVIASRPDYYAILLRPLTWLPYVPAYALFQAINLAALCAFLLTFRECKEIKWLALISIPLLTSFINGQDVPLVLFLFGSSVLLERRGHSWAAGCLLALCTIKFHFFVFVPVALIVWRKWRMSAGAVLTVAALALVAALVQGPDWPVRYLELLKRPELHPDTFSFMNVRGLASLTGDAQDVTQAVLSLVIGLLVCAFVWRSRGKSFETTLAVCLTGGLLVSYHLGIHDCSLLLAVVALAGGHGVLRSGAAALATPIPYYLLLVGGPLGALPAAALFGLFVVTVLSAFRQETRMSPALTVNE